MPRIDIPTREELGPEGREIYDKIGAVRDGIVSGPFSVWLRTPTVAAAANELGNSLRITGSLNRRVFELLTLACASHWRAAYPWAIHAAAARSHGVDDAVLDAVHAGRVPDDGQPDERLACEVGFSILKTGGVPSELFERAREAFGVEGVIEMVTTIGFYSTASLVTNVFDIPAPDGEEWRR
jgi:4-carboxymuconolactone decarboxylase